MKKAAAPASLVAFRQKLAARARYLARNPGPIDQAAGKLAFVLACALPLALLHARAAAEMLIAAIDLLFLLHLWAVEDRRALAGPFAAAAFLWWGWQALCSAIGAGGFWMALAAIRLPLLTLALGRWVLTPDRRRRLLWMLLVASAAWVALECWQQMLLGTNLFGQPRWGDGALTGPFNKPRAGPALVLLLFPVIVPLLAPGRLGSTWVQRLRTPVIIAFSLATMLLIGQRMPAMLTVLGLVLTGLAVRRLRFWLALALAAGGALLAAMPFLTPAAYQKLVIHTREQLGDFHQNTYGQIFAHAAGMIRQHPWIGQGFDAFRRACAHAGKDDLACSIHPHNYYLEAGVNGGVPLLLLFTLMALAAIATIARSAPSELRLGLLIGAVIALWPIASTSALTSMPNSGWVFLILGLGVA